MDKRLNDPKPLQGYKSLQVVKSAYYPQSNRLQGSEPKPLQGYKPLQVVEDTYYPQSNRLQGSETAARVENRLQGSETAARVLAIIILFLLSLPAAYSQTQPTPQDTVQKTKVELLRADEQIFNRRISDQRQLLMGNVVFRHDSSYMYCDSAYFYEQDKSLEAFSRVRMEQGDTLFVYGDYLHYDGNVEIARMRRNVRMINIKIDTANVNARDSMTLYTDSLDYNRITNIGYYFNGGKLVDSTNVLTSVYGQYSTATKIALFNDSVVLTNYKDVLLADTNFILHSDTLEYSTDSRIATILGPSVIESDSGTILTSHGWFNTQNNTSQLLDYSEVLSGNRYLTGKILKMNRETGVGEAFNNMSIRDTTQKITITGNYGYFEDKNDYAFATDSALALEYSQGDTLYLHADTLELTTVDSARILRAFTGVRFYRDDIQGVCDYMRFNSKDSILYMYGDPVLWNENQQLFGDSIIVYMSDSTVEYVHVPSGAFVVQKVDSGYHNQLGGSDLKAYFVGKAIEHIDIDGNAESIFFPLERDSTMVGLNYTQSSYLSIWLKENKLEKMKIWPQPKGYLIPIHLIQSEQMTLKRFVWHGDIRPTDRHDVFRTTPIKTDKPPTDQELKPIPKPAPIKQTNPELPIEVF
ncbi:MAG: hypothetical protein LBD53_08690 [Tannerella sp.]|jgi:lipopolysaccharide export system protein LptA|nr:hypothetical protein [Tannerella sp.]